MSGSTNSASSRRSAIASSSPTGLPLFPYMEIKLTPLAKHPSDISAAG
jgi:muconolactone delta-isomerase